MKSITYNVNKLAELARNKKSYSRWKLGELLSDLSNNGYLIKTCKVTGIITVIEGEVKCN